MINFLPILSCYPIVFESFKVIGTNGSLILIFFKCLELAFFHFEFFQILETSKSFILNFQMHGINSYQKSNNHPTFVHINVG